MSKPFGAALGTRALLVNFKRLFRRDTFVDDAVSGVVLGVESVPDSLASGLLAGVNPVFGLYGAMWGTFTGALFTSSAFMAVQTTGAMSIIVADVDEIANADDPATALFTLSIMTGFVMLCSAWPSSGCCSTTCPSRS